MLTEAAPYYSDDFLPLHHGDCLDILRTLPEESVDAVVTDPPYGLGFMGKAWDELPPGEEWATECLRVLKPGGHLLAFGGTRTWHRLACAVEDAGFEVRDSIAWMYGSGFPKSLDVSKAIDKAAGAERELSAITAPATPDAEQWQGWGTALKPAFEPVVVARKPLAGTVAANVLAHGTGALNVDGCRIEGEERTNNAGGTSSLQRVSRVEHGYRDAVTELVGQSSTVSGRWPANVVLDEAQAAELDQQSGELTSGANPEIRGGDTDSREVYSGFTGGRNEQPRRGTDSGGASRFFYVAKADQSERVKVDGIAHPTVKPLALMRWLVRLVTPPGGTVLEPFAGSGTTVEAGLLEGFHCIAIEREADYLPLIIQRINRRRDPVAAIKASADDNGLFALFEDEER